MLDLTWYYTLNRPPYTPPAWIFSPAWTILYLMIFLSLILYTIKRTNKSKIWGYVLFILQMIFNLIWTPVFFVFHNIALALAVIVVLDILVIFNIIEFFGISKPAAYLLMPYLLWLIYATYLTAGYFVLN